MRKILLFLLFFTHLSKTNHQVCILIHGTWGIKSDWYLPGGKFYDELNLQLAKLNIKLISFSWSGELSYEKRAEAGLILANLINSYPNSTKFNIIAHSHGGNVGIIASQLLKNQHQISAFYSLGMPIDSKNYLPNMSVIKYFYHLFSFGDIHQTALGMHERVLPKLKNCYNINVELNHEMPQHEELHDPIIAKWLLQISHVILQSQTCNNHFCAKLYQNSAPIITIENNLENKINYDQNWHKLMQNNLFSIYSSGRSLA